MSFFDVLFGRTKPKPAKADDLFALATPRGVTLEERLQLKPASRAGICFKAVSSSYFHELERDLDAILSVSGQETATKVDTTEDEYGFRWVVLEDPDLEDLVNTVYLVGKELQDHGFGEQLLAAVFRFEGNGRRVYWVYSFKRGKFYPFVPRGTAKQRDNALELQLQAVMSRELPIEPELERWFALWDIPV